MTKRIVITGGTGFVGRALCRDLLMHGYDVIVLSRNPRKAKPTVDSGITLVKWDGETPQGWLHYATGALAIINLAGENIASSLRWTQEKKELLLRSRLNAGKAVMKAAEQADEKPRVVIQASAIGYYGNRRDEVIDESSSLGAGFLAEVARQWETSIKQLTDIEVRCPIIRTGVVLGRYNGFLPRVTLPFRFFMGGHPGSGEQWLSWIHIDDEVAAIRFLIEKDYLTGPFNLTAPNPLKARDFFHLAGMVLKRPSWFHVPGFVLQLALGELAKELLLSSQRVIPKRLLDSGYSFQYPEALPALKDLLEKGD